MLDSKEMNFRDLKCVIQDLKTHEMIGSGVMHEGLVYLIIEECRADSINAEDGGTETLPNCAILHFRLGHLSSNIMKLMHNDFPFVNADEGSICDICHFSRHKRLTYVLSSSRDAKCYEMIHFDIWGLISTPSVHSHKYF